MLVNYEMFEEKQACEPALEWFKANFKGNVEFDSVYPLITDYGWIQWLICNCNFAQTNEMLEYYKSLNPSDNDVCVLIYNCHFAQTDEMMEYYKSLNPSDNDVSWLLDSCRFAEEYFERQRAEGVRRWTLLK